MCISSPRYDFGLLCGMIRFLFAAEPEEPRPPPVFYFQDNSDTENKNLQVIEGPSRSNRWLKRTYAMAGKAPVTVLGHEVFTADRFRQRLNPITTKVPQ